ncbi:NAD(P)H-dependent flavin oxidoreductase [Photobacterium kasasachensis]|uniref:NAD(P)H-dependent flavin oxidoreductase n=1 Tax=Photobacterium kasasachensis TaxID=2910240 RepID=UPI003D14B543
MDNKHLVDILGTELPLIQAPMAGVQDSALTIAVSEAGGLGSLPCGMLGIDDIINEITEIKRATSKPYNLNFFCHSLPEYDINRQSQWQTLLKPYFSELGMNCQSSPQGATRVPFSHNIADVIEPFQPEIISFHFGLPDDDLLERVKGWGSRIISSATTVQEAQWLESRGVDGIIAQGFEAGGHRGMFLTDDLSTQVGTFALVSQIANTVRVPVIAAGGIADNKGVQAALTLGATAVQVGTAYLLCDEAKTSQLHRTALKNSQVRPTAVTNLFTGRPARGIVNRVMKELGAMNTTAPAFPYASIEMAQLRKLAEGRRIDDFSPLWSGQNTTGCKEISASELTRQLMSGITV